MNQTLISKYLQELRKRNGYTQENLSDKLNITRQAVSKWETGNTLPDLEVLLKLSDLYQITINEILEPKIKADCIADFENILDVPEKKLKKILTYFKPEDMIKVSMGASPNVNHYLEQLFPDLNFTEEQRKIGRVKMEEVEMLQNQIVSFINLECGGKVI